MFDIFSHIVNNILNLIKLSGQSHWERESWSESESESEKGIKLSFICKIVTHSLAHAYVHVPFCGDKQLVKLTTTEQSVKNEINHQKIVVTKVFVCVCV